MSDQGRLNNVLTVWVPHRGDESHLGRLERVFRWEGKTCFKKASFAVATCGKVPLKRMGGTY